MKAKMYLAAFALIATASLVSAQGQKKSTNSESKKSCYVDANNNNVCDKHEDKSCTQGNGKGLHDGSGNGKGLHNGNGHGNGNGQGKGNKKGANYVDTNKDGVCDNK